MKPFDFYSTHRQCLAQKTAVRSDHRWDDNFYCLKFGGHCSVVACTKNHKKLEAGK